MCDMFPTCRAFLSLVKYQHLKPILNIYTNSQTHESNNHQQQQQQQHRHYWYCHHYCHCQSIMKTWFIYNIHVQFLNNVNKPTPFSVRKVRTGPRLDFFPSIVVYQLQQMTNSSDVRRKSLFNLHLSHTEDSINWLSVFMHTFHNKAYPIILVTCSHRQPNRHFKKVMVTFYKKTKIFMITSNLNTQWVAIHWKIPIVIIVNLSVLLTTY